jgi:hypothetical protein
MFLNFHNLSNVLFYMACSKSPDLMPKLKFLLLYFVLFCAKNFHSNLFVIRMNKSVGNFNILSVPFFCLE